MSVYYSVAIRDAGTGTPLFFGYFSVDTSTIASTGYATIITFYQGSSNDQLQSPFTSCLLPKGDVAFPSADNYFNTTLQRFSIEGVNISSTSIQAFYGYNHANFNINWFGTRFVLYYQGSILNDLSLTFALLAGGNPNPIVLSPYDQYEALHYKMQKPLFSDNSLVYYKPSALAAGGVNTVVNSRHKARKV